MLLTQEYAFETDIIPVIWVKLCSPKIYVQLLTPSSSECDLTWKQGHCRCDYSHVPHNDVLINDRPHI